jgi:hypothetical protein
MNYSTSGPLALCLFTLTAGLLSACGGGNGKSTQQQFEEDALVGSYSQAYVDNLGQPHLLKAVLLDAQNLTLVDFDAEDNTRVYAGNYSANNGAAKVAFGDMAQCQKEGQLLSCVVQGQTLMLTADTAETLPTLSSLSGGYAVMFNGAHTPIAVDAAGKFSLSYNNCPLKGEISLGANNTQLGLRITSASCGYSLAKGFVEFNSLYSSNDSLAVYLPSSPLSGYWLH